mmetsp:Transcript_16202/g.48681  ORF Transcript_16202/g.48681 Transcript_16202/m.48681 type:complete len:675 (+) Transcript_16202:56-2080(+)
MAATSETLSIPKRGRSASQYERANPLLAQLVLVRGQGLAAKDANGLSDPYAVGVFTSADALQDPKQSSKHEVKFRTKTIFKSLHPAWNHNVYLGPYEPTTDVVQVQVWDKDPIPPHDFLGECVLSLRECNKVGSYEYNLPLSSRSSKRDRVSGKVVIQVHVTEATEVVRQGYLLKKGRVNKAWRKRWCILHPDSITYYVKPPGVSSSSKKRHQRSSSADGDSEAGIRGRLVFSPTTSIEPDASNSSHTHCFTIHMFDEKADRHLELRTPPDEDPKPWETDLQKILPLYCAPEETEPVSLVFGGSLADIMRAQEERGIRLPVPEIVHYCLKYLRLRAPSVVGPFRLSGSSRTINTYKTFINRGQMISVSFENNPHNVTCLLKEFLRDLAEPVLTYDLYVPWLNLGSAEISEKEKLQCAEELLSVLPPENRAVVREIISFAHELTSHEETTLMSAQNLSIVFGPNLLRSPSADPLLAMSDFALINCAAEFLILNSPTLFPEAPPRPSRLPPQLTLTLANIQELMPQRPKVHWKPPTDELVTSIPKYAAPAAPSPPTASVSSKVDLRSTLHVCPKSRPASRMPLCRSSSRLLKVDDIADQVAASMFSAYDHNNRGSLDPPEFLNLLQDLIYTHQLPSSTEEELWMLMNEIDQDQSGNISLDEFIAWWHKHTAKQQQK